MKKNCRTISDRGSLSALFSLFARFAYYRMTASGLRMEAFGPSWRFSTWLRCARRGPQLLQKAGHRPSQLRHRRKRTAGLPGSIPSLQQRTSQHQQIVRAGDDVRPAPRPLRSTQPWPIPEQLLFVKPIAMLLRVAQAIRRAHLGQRGRLFALPDKPADLGVTGLTTGSMTDDLDHASLDLPSRAQVQVGPTAHLDARPFGVSPFPTFLRVTMAALVLALKAVSILAAGSQLTRKALWGGTGEDAIAFDPQQAGRLDIGQPSQEGCASIPAVADTDRMQATSHQQGHHRAQLTSGHLGDQFGRSHPRRVQNEGSLPGLLGQEHHVTKDPARTSGVCVLGQIGDGNQGAILSSLGLGAVQVAGVSSQKTHLPCRRQGREVHKELAQALGIDLAVFQCFLQAGPAALKKRRERHFGEAAGCRFTSERIHQIEQGVFGVAKAVRHPVTKCVECVKVHPSNAPQFDAGGYITPLSNPFTRIAELTLV
jgi:hypothetical protein